MIENKTLTPFQEFVNLASQPFVPPDVADTLITRYINAPTWERPLIHQETQKRVAGLQRRNDWQEAVRRANENERATQQSQSITSQTDPAVFRNLRAGLEKLDRINQQVLRQQRRMIGEPVENSPVTPSESFKWKLRERQSIGGKTPRTVYLETRRRKANAHREASQSGMKR